MSIQEKSTENKLPIFFLGDGQDMYSCRRLLFPICQEPKSFHVFCIHWSFVTHAIGAEGGAGNGPLVTH